MSATNDVKPATASHASSHPPGRIDGRELAAKRYAEIRNEILSLGRARPPGLAVIQVGNNPASASYIRQKQKSAETCGVHFQHVHLPSDISKADLEKSIRTVCADSRIDGAILQLPLDSPTLQGADLVEHFLSCIPPEKDADGLLTQNLGRLFAGLSSPDQWTSPLPATAFGVLMILKQAGVKISGAEAVVVGKSRLVGLPTATLLTNLGATVTICHSRTADLTRHTREAQILVVAAGRKHLVGAFQVREGAVVVDVGIHSDGDKKLTGDVNPEAFLRASKYTPVPGGVGPMTVAGLLENTFRLWKARPN